MEIFETPVIPGGSAALIAVHEGAELLGAGDVLADLADLAADGDRQALRLAGPDEAGEVRGVLEVAALLLDDGGLREIDERRRVDVDVEEARRDRVADQGLDGLPLAVGVRRVLLGVDLEVVALDEDRALVPFPDGGGEEHGGVLARLLVRVPHLAAGDLEDERADVVLLRRAEDRARRVVREHPDVDGGGREAAGLAAPDRHVEVVNRRGEDAVRRRGGPDGVTRFVALRDIALEDGLPDEGVDSRAAKGGRVSPGVLRDLLHESAHRFSFAGVRRRFYRGIPGEGRLIFGHAGGRLRT